MNYEYINKIIEDVYSEFGDKYGDELNKLLTKEQKENETIDKIKEITDNINNQYETIPDKELITNRVVDISVIDKINEILEEIE